MFGAAVAAAAVLGMGAAVLGGFAEFDHYYFGACAVAPSGWQPFSQRHATPRPPPTTAKVLVTGDEIDAGMSAMIRCRDPTLKRKGRKEKKREREKGRKAVLFLGRKSARYFYLPQ